MAFDLPFCSGMRALRPKLLSLAIHAVAIALLILLACVLAPLAWSHARRLRVSKTPGELIALLGATGKFLALYAALFAAGVVL